VVGSKWKARPENTINAVRRGITAGNVSPPPIPAPLGKTGPKKEKLGATGVCPLVNHKIEREE